MATYKVPKSPAKSIMTINHFLGVDFTNSPANIDINRSPNAENMIRDVPGKVRKSMGWEVIEEYDGKINGCYSLKNDEDYIVHAGTKIYHGTDLIYSNANDERSSAWQFDDKLYILDGKQILVYSQTKDGDNITHNVAPVSSVAKIPTVTISKNPTGGGTSYEDLNLLQPGFEEHFLGTADATEYSLSFSPLDDTEVKVEVLGADGEWQTKVEDTDFTVDRQTGVVTFTTAPGVSPVTGEDNVKITAYRTVEGYADRINKCTFGILYGANGGHDRLFVSGNPDYINYDWHSESYDPTYFSDTSYARLGSDASRIVGYSRVSSYLATHKDDFEKDQNIILRSGSTIDDLTVFKIANSLSGAGAIASGSFGYLANEPLFLTSQGIFAITAQDVTGEKYAQNRSFYLNGKLLEEENLEDACSVVFKDMYWLCVNDRCYILDGLQAVQTDKSMPYATRQYCGFYRTNVPANVMWVYDNKLWFGTRDGRICRFHTDKGSVTSYNDNGQPISACWETPDIDGNLFYKNKSVRYLAVRLESAIATSIKIWAMERGLWNFVTSDDAAGRFFTYKNFTYSKFTYACDRTQKITKTKLRIKKVDKFRLKFENDKTNEPFGLYDVAIEFVENGNFKG